MQNIERFPALPLIANDPFFSVWMPADSLTAGDTVHWSGAPLGLSGWLDIDGRAYTWLGRASRPEMETLSLHVTPSATVSVLQAAGVRLTVRFWAPVLPQDLDALSTPVTILDYQLESTDDKAHEATFHFHASSNLCYNGRVRPAMLHDGYTRDGLTFGFIGQQEQHLLGQSGDRITIDWGYLYLAAHGAVTHDEEGLGCALAHKVGSSIVYGHVLVGYDDVASIDYFGVPCRAWYSRKGQTLPDAMVDFDQRHDVLAKACRALDISVLAEAETIGGKDYAQIVSAAWRHTFAAHKLIVTPEGEMAFLSKENDSNGCIGTVDVSYPSIPLFLKYCPELVNALARPVLKFASLPVWEEDFAPHDVGRYPHAIGQVYACKHRLPNGPVYPPYYLYPAGCGIYDFRYQMPVEECGNMLVMLETALSFGAKDTLLKQYAPILEKWVAYLDRYGDDPGDQLCTDDFAGHLAHNINLSAKAVVGIACYARMMKRLNRPEEAARWESRAHKMAAGWLRRVDKPNGSPLTFDGQGWSMKYNLCWDRVLDLHLLPEDFYKRETASYLLRLNCYGLPLDSRADYTKSDWTVWAASLASDRDTFRTLIAPLGTYLRETTSRVPFSDWYDTKTGRYVAFIGRSVQGGVFMPMLMKQLKA